MYKSTVITGYRGSQGSHNQSINQSINNFNVTYTGNAASPWGLMRPS